MPDVGDALLEASVLTAEQVASARQSSDGSLAKAIVASRLMSEDAYVTSVAERFSLQPESRVSAPDPDAIAALPERAARKHRALALRKEGAMLVIAVDDPSDPSLVDRLARASGASVKLVVAGPNAIDEGIQQAYAGGAAGGAGKRAAPKEVKGPGDHAPPLSELERVINQAVQEIHPDDMEDTGDELPRLEIRELDPPVVRLIHALLLKALKMGASDLHVETLEEELRIRFRVDGHLVEVARFHGDMKSALVSCMKIMADMDIAEKRVPQDGGIKFAIGKNENIDFRVSSLPNLYGEKMVLRVLGTSELRDSIDDLGFEGRALEIVREAVANPYGMILVTGPTGSGKTTTLYTILNQLNDPGTNIVTAEDPVEYRLEGITQVGIRAASGLTFDKALKSFLRQDPDTILVGEMRDYETAAIAVKAALTGHLVLSTLHTNDAPSTVVRLVDMGIEPYLVSSAVKVVIAQRLLRRICSDCKQPVDLAELEKSDLDQSTLAMVESLWRGAGCETCNGSGYKGRVPIFEVLGVKSKEMKRAITEGGTEVQVAQIAKREGMLSLAEAALEQVNRGVTSIEEAASIILAE